MNSLSAKSQNANLGNITRLKLVPVADVTAIKNRNRDGSTIVTDQHRLKGTPFLMVSGYRVFDVAVPAGGCNYEETLLDAQAGAGYRQSIATTQPDDSTTIRGQLRNFADAEFIAIFEDAAGQVRLMGTKYAPVKLISSFSTAGMKGRNIALQAICKHPAYLLDSYTNASLFTTTDDGLENDYEV